MKLPDRSEDWTRFTTAMRKILSVSKDELNKREAEYKKHADLNPKKRGPKPTRKPRNEA